MLYLQLLLPQVFLPMFWKFVTRVQTNKPTFLPQLVPLFYVESQLTLDTTQSNIISHHVKHVLIKQAENKTWFYKLVLYTL